MTLLTRYLLKQHAAPFVFAFSALTGFLLLNQVAKRIEELLGKGLPWHVIVEFFALTIPFLIAMTLSMSVLVAVLYAFSRMTEDREITAMRAGGISLGQLVRPLLAAAGGVAVVAFLFGDQVLPRSNHRLRSLMVDIYRTKPTFTLKEHVINEVQRGRYALRTAQIDRATYRMRDVALYDLTDPARTRTIYADSGRLAFAPNQEDLELTLFDGIIHEFDRDDPRMFQQTAYRHQTVMVRGIGSEFVRRDEDTYRGDRELGTCELEEVVRTATRERLVAERQARAAWRNGLRALVGLGGVAADTAVATPGRSVYCRGLGLVAAWLAPEPLQAQRRAPDRDSLLPAVDEQLARPARSVQLVRKMPSALGAEYRVLQDRARAARVRGAVYAVEFHKKYSIPAACIVFVLVGVPVAMRFPGGGVGLVIGAGMAIFGGYYIGLIGGESLANRLIVTPFWAMWLPNLVMGGAGAAALWLTRRAGAAAPDAKREWRWSVLRAPPGW